MGQADKEQCVVVPFDALQYKIKKKFLAGALSLRPLFGLVTESKEQAQFCWPASECMIPLQKTENKKMWSWRPALPNRLTPREASVSLPCWPLVPSICLLCNSPPSESMDVIISITCGLSWSAAGRNSTRGVERELRHHMDSTQTDSTNTQFPRNCSAPNSQSDQMWSFWGRTKKSSLLARFGIHVTLTSARSSSRVQFIYCPLFGL